MISIVETTNGELALLIGGLREDFVDLKADVAEIRTQTTKTNGRVNELEVERRIRQAVDTERAHALAAAARERKAEAAAESAAESGRRVRRQWLVNTAIAAGSMGTGAIVAIVTLT